MEHWGELVVTKIEDGSNFWCLISELTSCEEDRSSWWLECIVEAFKNGDLFGLEVVETDAMFHNRSREHPMFSRDFHGQLSFYLLPCLCVRNGDNAVLLWTHPRARKNGFGARLVTGLGIRRASNILPESRGFWEKVLPSAAPGE